MSPVPPDVAEALAAWGLVAREATALEGGAVNEHWRVVVAGAGPARVLRRYNPRHDPHGTAYEHDLLAFLVARSWPVAAPIATAAGETVVETSAGRWALFPFLEGAPPPEDLIFLQRKGALLALLHDDLRGWEVTDQRPGWGRVDDLDIAVSADGYRSAGELLEWWRGEEPVRAEALERIRDRTVGSLELFGYDELPAQTIYNECFRANVLFEGDDVSALLDWDFAHRDARIADIGRSLFADGRVDGHIEPWRLTRWIAGYQAHADPPLSEREAELLPAVITANVLWDAAVSLSIHSRRPTEWMIRWVRRAVDETLPDLESRQGELRRIVRTAAGYTSV